MSGRTLILFSTTALVLVTGAVAFHRPGGLLSLTGLGVQPKQTGFAGFVEPATLLAGSAVGGTVVEVRGHAGDRVSKGDLLVRCDGTEFLARRRALQAALHVARTVRDAGLQNLLIQADPRVRAAEDFYVRALAGYEQAGSGEQERRRIDLDNAARARTLAIGRSSATLAHVADLESRLGDLDRAIAGLEIRAPSNGMIDLIGVHHGDRLIPGQPAVIFLPSEEFASEFVVPADREGSLRPGAHGWAILDESGKPFRWRIDSITLRRIPAAHREQRQVGQEVIVHARFSSREAIALHAAAHFSLP